MICLIVKISSARVLSMPLSGPRVLDHSIGDSDNDDDDDESLYFFTILAFMKLALLLVWIYQFWTLIGKTKKIVIVMFDSPWANGTFFLTSRPVQRDGCVSY